EQRAGFSLGLGALSDCSVLSSIFTLDTRDQRRLSLRAGDSSQAAQVIVCANAARAERRMFWFASAPTGPAGPASLSLAWQADQLNFAAPFIKSLDFCAHAPSCVAGSGRRGRDSRPLAAVQGRSGPVAGDRSDFRLPRFDKNPVA